MFKNTKFMKQIQGDNFGMNFEPKTGSDLTMQEKLEIILERPNYSQLRAAEDAAELD